MAKQTKKKGKTKHSPGGSPADLVRQAEAKLQGGEIDAAVRLLLRADGDLQQSAVTSVAKGTPLPPQVVELRPRIAQLLPRALLQRAFLTENPRQLVTDLEEAVRRSPTDARSRVALGAVRVANGDLAEALEQFRQAQKSAPEDAPAGRGYALGLLAAGHTGEFGEWLPKHSGTLPSSTAKRLTTLRDLIDGNFSLSPTTASAGKKPAAPRAKKGASGTEGESDDLEKLADRLQDSLVAVAQGEGQRARKQLQARPRRGPEPTGAAAVIQATQHFYLGALHFQAGALAEATAAFRAAQALSQPAAFHLPWAARLVPYYRALAERALNAEDLALAARCWEAIRELDPQDVAAANLEAVQRFRAYQAWREERWEEAIPLLEEGLRTSPEDEELRQALAIATEKAERIADAIGHWRALGERWRKHLKEADALFRERLLQLEEHLVDLMIRADRPGYEIQNELDALIKLDPENLALRQKVATLLIEIDRAQPALKHLEFIERRQGETADVLALKGFTLGYLARFEASLKAFERALELDPAHATTRMAYLPLLVLRGETAEEDERPDLAVPFYRRALAIDPEFAPALSHLASALFDLEETAEAEQLVERLLAIRPELAQRNVVAGGLYLRFGRPRKAEAQFKRARELDPGPQCLQAIGEAYLYAGNRTKALQSFDRAIRAGNIATTLAVARTLFESDFADDAEKYIDKALEEMPLHPEAHLARGIFLYEKGEMEQAESAFALADEFASLFPGFEVVREEVQEYLEEIEEERENADLLKALENLPRDMPLPRHLQRRLAELEKRK